ncbi:MAG: right-handed parallel beta-helix repeat-containing protein [Sedimentisphaerales bacterium]|nr:right-handed parallel beta-helix repeat-containing protein [Sedimentisphaerales bacterium]
MKNSARNGNCWWWGVVAVTIGMCAMPLSAAEYFVSPQGADDAAGTREEPFATLHRAASQLKPGDTCYLREGVYCEVLRPQRSGTPGAEITFANWRNERVVISGADVVTGWRDEGEGVHSAPMPWSLGSDNQCFADGVMLSEACWPAPGEAPLFKPNRAVASGGSTTTLVCEQIPGADGAWRGARLWCAGGAAWICWTSDVTAYDADSHTLTFKQPRDTWYTARKGNLFALRGLRRALHAPGQWFYNEKEKRLLVIPPEKADIESIVVEAKRRLDAIDLSGRSHIRIRGIGFRAVGVRTDSKSSHIVLENLHGRYVAHSNVNDVSGKSGVLVTGHDNLLLSCDLGYSSSSVVNVSGHDNRVINCHIHHGGYGGLWRGTVALSGRRIVFSHNTVRHAGRDLINTHGLMESLVQYNDVSDAGWLTKDLGMFYGHNTDFANTEFCYNLVHDNHAEHCAMGIYFDHLSHNAIVHHNVVWNVGMDPIRINNPSYCGLVFNNTCARTGAVGTFDHSNRNDLFASRYFNNIFNQKITLPDHVALYNNHMIQRPSFRDPDNADYRLKEPVDHAAGAYAPDGVLWRAGCDLKHPPSPLPAYKPPRLDWMNVIRNSCFEFGTLERWRKTDASRAELVKGNGWGNPVHGSSKAHATGTSKYELRLGPGRDGVSQVVTGLSPGIAYTLSAWLRVSDESEAVILAVKPDGGSETGASVSSTQWTRRSIEFTIGPGATQATIYLRKLTAGDGHAWCDNLTLPLRPAAQRR